MRLFSLNLVGIPRDEKTSQQSGVVHAVLADSCSGGCGIHAVEEPGFEDSAGVDYIGEDCC